MQFAIQSMKYNYMLEGNDNDKLERVHVRGYYDISLGFSINILQSYGVIVLF